MKGNKSRPSLACIKYLAPCVTVLSMPTLGYAGVAAPANQYTCSATKVNYTASYQYATTKWKLVAGPTGLQRTGAASQGESIKLPFIQNRTYAPTDARVWINTLYAPQTLAGKGCGSGACSGCTFKIKAKVTNVRERAEQPLVPQLNRLNRLNHMMAATEQVTRHLPAHSLANITLQLVLSELNNVPDGLHLNPGETIDAKLLTKEQRTVLNNHNGLIKEALRQLKAALRAEKQRDVSGATALANPQ